MKINWKVCKTYFKYLAVCLTALTIVMISPQTLKAVGGISNSKLIVPSAETVPPHQFEFEPAIGVQMWDRVFGDQGDTHGISGDAVGSGLSFRMTPGITRRSEAGFTIGVEQETFRSEFGPAGDMEAVNLSDLVFGGKYRFMELENGLMLALQGGINIPTGSARSHGAYEGGFILTYNPNDWLSIDADWSYISFDGGTDGDPESGQIFDVGVSVAATDSLLLIAELNGFQESLRHSGTMPDRAWGLTPTTGIGYTVSDHTSVWLGASWPVRGWGANAPFGPAYMAAFTLLFE